MTGVSRNNEDVLNKLGSGQSFGSSYSGGPLYGSPSSMGNSIGGQNSGGLNAFGFQQWETPPNAQQVGTPSNAQQWGTPPNASQWGLSPNFQPSVGPLNFHPGHQQGNSTRMTPTNVQYRFSVGSQEENVRNTQQDTPDGAAIRASLNVHQTSSRGLDFTNYFEAGHISHTPTPGGLFNIWKTPQRTSTNVNEGHQSYSEDEE
ncbi:hypothetical protein V5N11_036152 [Cardamine amara subsp. amara]|uniref:Uncharacterized protein n=1 Tax=Cardamine amara subsp. amara TaxID=228776 RepID=A0ABD1BXM3_CARAN